MATREMALYASEQFLAGMRAASFNQILLNQPNAEELARMARAGQTIPNLGGIALFGENELEAVDTTSGDQTIIGSAVEPQTHLTKFRDGRPVADAPLAAFSSRHEKAGTHVFSLVVPPDEAAIAKAFYKAAVQIPGQPSEDQWMAERTKEIGFLGAAFGPFGVVAGLGIRMAGQKLGEWRQDYDLSHLVRSKPPVELRTHGAVIATRNF